MISCENQLQSHMDTVVIMRPNCVHPTTLSAGLERFFGSIGFVQTGAGPAWNLMKNSVVGLGECEQKTIYQGPWSIWKERVNYKQQRYRHNISILNDVILTLKLPETHLLRTAFCSVNYPLRF